MATGMYPALSAVGKRRALFRRGRCNRIRHAGGRKASGFAENLSADPGDPGAAFSRVSKPLDTCTAGPCSSRGEPCRQGGDLLPNAQPRGVSGTGPASGGWICLLYWLLYPFHRRHSVYLAVCTKARAAGVEHSRTAGRSWHDSGFSKIKNVNAGGISSNAPHSSGAERCCNFILPISKQAYTGPHWGITSGYSPYSHPTLSAWISSIRTHLPFSFFQRRTVPCPLPQFQSRVCRL